MLTTRERVVFENKRGLVLSGRLELPVETPRAYGVFAHCFTCSKDIFAAVRICTSLAERGIAMLRFDFSGIGGSQGDFSQSNFSTNVEDIIAACDFLQRSNGAPQILIGHSLGGAAVLRAWEYLPAIKAMVTINSPCEPIHVARVLEDVRDQIMEVGKATITIGGNSFVFTRQFVEDLESYPIETLLRSKHPALLVMHAPADQTVNIDQAAKIFMRATHPKSFVSLDDSDHLVSKKEDAAYIAYVIEGWVNRYLPR